MAQVLAERPRRSITATTAPQPDGIELTLDMTGLDRVDVYLDSRPRHTLDLTDGRHVLSVAVGGPGQYTLDVRRFFSGELAAQRRIAFTFG